MSTTTTFDEWFKNTIYTDIDCAKDAWESSRKNLLATKVLQHLLSFPDTPKHNRWAMEDALHELVGERGSKGYMNIHTGEKIWINKTEKLEDYDDLLNPSDYKRCKLGER